MPLNYDDLGIQDYNNYDMQLYTYMQKFLGLAYEPLDMVL